jgi:hypothetical protein
MTVDCEGPELEVGIGTSVAVFPRRTTVVNVVYDFEMESVTKSLMLVVAFALGVRGKLCILGVA